MATTRYSIPELAAAQAQKHVTVNEALQVIDAAMNLVVIRRDLTDPPIAPAVGDKYIPASPAGGIWSGRENSVAAFIGGYWTFFEPEIGWRAFDQSTGELLVWDGSAWRDYLASAMPARLGVNTTADAVNRLAVKADAVLLSHDDVTPGSGDMRVTLNKAAENRDAGLVLQSSFSTRWLAGMFGNDDFVLKNSPDGSSYPQPPALTVKNKSGRAIFKKVQNGLRPWNVVLRDYVAGSPFLLSSSAVDNAWRCICWSPELGIFAAVATTGTGNRVMTSPDGINWTSRASAADNQWTSVCWSPELGLFAAVANTGTGNRVMTSLDGINWTLRASAADNQWFSVCWSPELGLFAAVADSGTGNRVMTSPDGINWTVRASAADNAWRSVCWSPELGLFAAVSIGGAGNRVMTSPDGVNWTIRASAVDNAWISVCWSPELGLFAATSITGTGNRVMTSPDGINWTSRASAADNEWYFVCWSGELGLFAATSISGAGNRVMTSPDGVNWTARASATDNAWISICWSPELGLFAATATGGTGNRVMTSKSAYSYPYR